MLTYILDLNLSYLFIELKHYENVVYSFSTISAGVFFLIPSTLKSLSNVIIVKSYFWATEN